jgi:hypothetical protein
MKKVFTTTLLIIIFKLAGAQTQIPNGGFEQRQHAFKFTSWESTNGLMTLGNPQTIFQSTEAHSGEFACEIITAYIPNRPTPEVPKNAGNVFCGRQIQYDSYMRFPYTAKPKTFEAWYIYNARNGDSANFVLGTTRWNTTLNRRDTLSYAKVFITDSVGVYTHLVVDLNILDSINTPDSAMVVISAASGTTAFTGTRLLFDDVAYLGGTVGLETFEKQNFPYAYPNPTALGAIYLDIPSQLEETTFTLYSLNGKLLLQHLLEPNKTNELNLPELTPGVYLYQLENKQRKVARKLIVY